VLPFSEKPPREIPKKNEGWGGCWGVLLAPPPPPEPFWFGGHARGGVGGVFLNICGGDLGFETPNPPMFWGCWGGVVLGFSFAHKKKTQKDFFFLYPMQGGLVGWDLGGGVAGVFFFSSSWWGVWPENTPNNGGLLQFFFGPFFWGPPKKHKNRFYQCFWGLPGLFEEHPPPPQKHPHHNPPPHPTKTHPPPQKHVVVFGFCFSIAGFKNPKNNLMGGFLYLVCFDPGPPTPFFFPPDTI